MLTQQRQIRAGVCLSLCEADFTGPSQSARIKCERHTITTLKSMRRRRVVARLRLAAHNDKGGGGDGITQEGGAHHKQGRRSAKVVCSRAERLGDMGFR